MCLADFSRLTPTNKSHCNYQPGIYLPAISINCRLQSKQTGIQTTGTEFLKRTIIIWSALLLSDRIVKRNYIICIVFSFLFLKVQSKIIPNQTNSTKPIQTWAKQFRLNQNSSNQTKLNLNKSNQTKLNVIHVLTRFKTSSNSKYKYEQARESNSVSSNFQF